MKKSYFLFLLFFASLSGFSQALLEKYPKVFYSQSDTISIEYSILKGKKFKMALLPNDTISPGTNGDPRVITKLFIGSDSLSLPYKCLPYAQKTYVTIETPKGKAVVAVRYNAMSAYFTPKYIQEHSGTIEVEHPEVYELANIIWTLSPSGSRSTDLNTHTEYYQRVKAYFSPYLNHLIFKQLDFVDSLYTKNYFDFRENSFTFMFKGNSIVPNNTYYYVMGSDTDSYTSLFKTLIPLVEDFAKQSNFKKFYKQNEAFYQKQTDRLSSLLPIQNMWSWLEKEFPDNKYQSYKIVFSPLIGGSHSTQNFNTFIPDKKESFMQTVMFICDAEKFDLNLTLNEEQKRGLLSGVVFTEIDHNYVNPVSKKYKTEINKLFGQTNVWASTTSWYSNPMSVFNEYMTHAVFCLWVKDNFDKTTADYVINAREEMNVDKRGFVRFKEFNQALLKLKELNPTLKVVDLYPLILKSF